jgi:hypothetical protein
VATQNRPPAAADSTATPPALFQGGRDDLLADIARFTEKLAPQHLRVVPWVAR